MPVVVTDAMVAAACTIYVAYQGGSNVAYHGGSTRSMKAAIQAALEAAEPQPTPTPPDDWRTTMEARLSKLEAAAKPAEPAFDGTFGAAKAAAKAGKKVGRSEWSGDWYLKFHEGQWTIWDDRDEELNAVVITDSAKATDWVIVHD